MMRSKLFVPGSRPELFVKALASAAEALSFDLEDSVTEAQKAEARDTLGQWLAQSAARAGGKVLIVRVNAQDTPHFAADVQAVVQPGLSLLNLPKVETPAQVLAAVQAVEQAESANGFAAAGAAPVRLLLNIETPRALLAAASLAGAHARVAGLQLGQVDLFEPLGIVRNEAALSQVMLMVRMAAGTAGLFACDGAFADIANPEGFRAEARLSQRLGFVGKSCIHPSQVALAHEVFRPSAEQIGHAQRVLQAATVAEAEGRGAFTVDGRMIDKPFVEGARALLAQAQRLGLLN